MDADADIDDDFLPKGEIGVVGPGEIDVDDEQVKGETEYRKDALQRMVRHQEFDEDHEPEEDRNGSANDHEPAIPVGAAGEIGGEPAPSFGGEGLPH